MTENTAILILAAGASSRMGQVKQLLEFGGTRLIQNSVRVALESACFPVCVVLGANAELIRKEIPREITSVVNQDWESGMAASIRVGIKRILRDSEAVENLIIMVCDQPFVSAEVLASLVEIRNRSGKGIVASFYDKSPGTPVLFAEKYFFELENLEGQKGAKQLLAKYKHDLEYIEFPLGRFDVDTPEDYQRLLNINQELKIK